MIVVNEQDVLADTLAGVRPIADQIVVLDTGSTDQTAAIARQFDALVGRWPWSDDFAAARNECLKLADGDWILWLEAGERLPADSAATLREFVDRQADRRHVYTLLVEMPPASSGAAAEQIAQPRLLPVGAKLRFEGRVRETLLASMAAAGLSLESAPGRIVRHPRERDPARKIRQADRDLRLATMEAAETGHWSARLLLTAGEACGTLLAPENAREAFRKAIALAPAESSELLEAYYGLLTTASSDPQSPDELLSVCLEALHVFPFDAQLLLALGNHLQGRGRGDLAVRAVEAALKFGKVNQEVCHLAEWKEIAAACLARIRQSQEVRPDAASAPAEAISAQDGCNYRLDAGAAAPELPSPHGMSPREMSADFSPPQ
jgi:tetratricopeptide (TPR) repeat protein